MKEEASAESALAEYYRVNYFGDHAFRDPWVWVKLGPISFPFPNPPARRAAIHLHDLTHMITGYDTSWTGEGEVAAYELASGFPPKFWIGWIYSPMTLFTGFLVAPRRVIRAWRRGRGRSNLYKLDLPWEELRTLSLGELRRRTGLLDQPSDR